MQKKNWRYVYMDNTPKLIELLQELERRIKKELPRLYKIFDELVKRAICLIINCQGCIPACFSQCFLTLLFYNSPLNFSKRVLDMFLLGNLLMEKINS